MRSGVRVVIIIGPRIPSLESCQLLLSVMLSCQHRSQDACAEQNLETAQSRDVPSGLSRIKWHFELNQCAVKACSWFADKAEEPFRSNALNPLWSSSPSRGQEVYC